MIDPVVKSLLAEIESFMHKHGLTATRFGLLADNDGHLVRRLRMGMAITSTRLTRVQKFMRNYRPPLGRRRSRESARLAG